jgi:glyoxylase-like metal-dependent hydrolase (beta-lactamase superfamily II)
MPGIPIGVAPGVTRVVAGNAGLMTGPGTNTYLLGTRELAVVDPGPDDAAHLGAILAAAGERPIRWVLVTHTHRDHSPLAAPLAAHSGARLIGLPAPNDGRQDASFRPEHVPGDGERLRLGDSLITAIHTPGHASNCLCYCLDAQRLLLSGDHVLEGVSPVILPPDGDMRAYLNSLAKLESQPFDRIGPGHGGILGDGKRMLGLLRSHRLAREKKLLACLSPHEGANLADLTARVYRDVPLERHVWAQLTLEAHLLKLSAEGRVSRHDGLWRLVST